MVENTTAPLPSYDSMSLTWMVNRSTISILGLRTAVYFGRFQSQKKQSQSILPLERLRSMPVASMRKIIMT